MLPILVSLGPIKIYSYGVFLFLALFAGLYWWWKIGRDEHWDEVKLFDAYFVAVMGYIVFGRIGYVLVTPDLHSLSAALGLLSFPGLNAIVGIFASFLIVGFFARRNDWESWKVADAYVVVLATILVIGSFGAILNGSNPGLISEWGIVHPGQVEKRIPVDMFTFFWSLIVFGIASRVRKNFRFYSWYKGDASVAKEGLAALVFGLITGVYWIVAGVLDDGSRLGNIPYLSILGFWVVMGTGCMIYLRSGKNKGEELLAKLRRKRV